MGPCNPIDAVGNEATAGSTNSRVRLPRAWKTVYLLITIMVSGASHPHLVGQELTPKAPPVNIVSLPLATTTGDLPDDPGGKHYPTAVPLPAKDDGTRTEIVSDTQSEKNGHYILDGQVII